MTEATQPPPDTPKYMYPAWASCLRWAAGEADILAAFREDTGFAWKPGNSPLDRMIDESCGMPDKFVEAFVPWFNENVWGSVK